MRRLLLATLAFVFVGCGDAIEGNGNVVEVGREVPNFQNLAVSGSINVEIQPGDTYALKIVSDENIIPYVVTDVKGDELQIHYKEKTNIRNADTRVVITVPFLNNISTSGSGDVISKEAITNNKMIVLKTSGSGDMRLVVNAPAVKLNGSGSGDFQLSGETKDMECKMSGSGDVDAKDLKAENVQVKIAGSGNVKTYASKTLSASIAGSGNVLYWGNPSLSNVSVAGSGKVRSGEGE